MGGLITRFALEAVQDRKIVPAIPAFSAFPPLLYVSHVVDLDTPNAGIPLYAQTDLILCHGVNWQTGDINACLQARQMLPDSAFMSDLQKKPHGQDPQRSGQGITWTLLGFSFN